MKRSFLIAAALAVVSAGSAMAERQSYAIMLGDRQLGTLVFESVGSGSALLSTMDNTPLGVANGTFEAQTQTRGGTVDYRAKSRGSKTRDVAVVREARIVTAVTVTPSRESTGMTQADKVPAGVISPTEVFAALADSDTCPMPMAMYDGRRVVQMVTVTTTRTSATETCEMSYRVVMGPGHLSPFHFKSLGMSVVYDARRLVRITMRGGGFDMNLVRQ